MLKKTQMLMTSLKESNFFKKVTTFTSETLRSSCLSLLGLCYYPLAIRIPFEWFLP